MPITKNRIEANLSRIRANIATACARANRSPEEVRLVAVTKMVESDTIRRLMEIGLTDLGENRVQQLTERAAETAEYAQKRGGDGAKPVRWHMIGHLQRNKVRQVLDSADVIHSVDSLRLAEEINARAERTGKVAEALLQVNCSEESQKFGCAVGATTHLGELICTLRNVRLLGLMTIAPLVEDPEKARHTFVRLRELYEEMRHEKIGGPMFRQLSMGMSQDYMVAVEEGATMVRIGSALFA